MASAENKKKLVILGGIFAVLAGVAIYMNLPASEKVNTDDSKAVVQESEAVIKNIKQKPNPEVAPQDMPEPGSARQARPAPKR